MSKNIRKNISIKNKPVKPPTVIDQTIRHFITDLLERGQIPVLHTFSIELGFGGSQVINAFLKGERNYPRQKTPHAINILTTKYNANKNFIETGHGAMYAGKPYMNEDSIPTIQEHPNMLGIGSVSALRKLEEKNKELEAQLKELRKLIDAQQETIHTQKKYINKLDK